MCGNRCMLLLVWLTLYHNETDFHEMNTHRQTLMYHILDNVSSLPYNGSNVIL